MPILLADGAGTRKLQDGTLGHDGAKYVATLEVLRSNPGCVGFHLCGAYLANRVRHRGLRNELEELDIQAVETIATANRSTTEWASTFK